MLSSPPNLFDPSLPARWTSLLSKAFCCTLAIPAVLPRVRPLGEDTSAASTISPTAWLHSVPKVNCITMVTDSQEWLRTRSARVSHDTPTSHRGALHLSHRHHLCSRMLSLCVLSVIPNSFCNVIEPDLSLVPSPDGSHTSFDRWIIGEHHRTAEVGNKHFGESGDQSERVETDGFPPISSPQVCPRMVARSVVHVFPSTAAGSKHGSIVAGSASHSVNIDMSHRLARLSLFMCVRTTQNGEVIQRVLAQQYVVRPRLASESWLDSVIGILDWHSSPSQSLSPSDLSVSSIR